jgi:hypothetical protein
LLFYFLGWREERFGIVCRYAFSWEYRRPHEFLWTVPKPVLKISPRHPPSGVTALTCPWVRWVMWGNVAGEIRLMSASFPQRATCEG